MRVLFLANFPATEALSEGMSQRMAAVDEQYEEYERAYLFVSHRLFWFKERYKVKRGALQYHCNLFRHFFFIHKLLKKADVIYIHSVINLLPLLPVWLITRKHAKVILDAHGVVPEEHLLAGKRWKGKLYGLSEKVLFDNVDTVITVSEAMKRHFQVKYPVSRARYILYRILPVNIVQDDYELEDHHEPPIRVVYSGNTQKWQHIELMISIIKENLSERIRYDILTGDLEQMRGYLRDAGLDSAHNVHVAKVSPQELKSYYKLAHYGFVLRDEIVVNRVACPTKLVEYLYYGIIPIVKSPSIGDFMETGYEFLESSSFSPEVKARKSAKNHAIIKRWLAADQALDVKKLMGR
ncbi:glycosyltransferase [Parapedobacter deserti]|uniref:Glycosyltransferase n=1 Tax=Parapedobacter deserti TaxID=1912957 RepID=A0ABV7JMH3_9SPHI